MNLLKEADEEMLKDLMDEAGMNKLFHRRMLIKAMKAAQGRESEQKLNHEELERATKMMRMHCVHFLNELDGLSQMKHDDDAKEEQVHSYKQRLSGNQCIYVHGL